jgi:hypothetical protein
MAIMAKGEFSCAPIEEPQQLIKKPRPKVPEENKWGVDIPGHSNVRAAIERHPAIVRQNPTYGYLPSQNGTLNHLVTCWRWKANGAPPARRA